MEIAILLTTFNSEKYIKEQLDSLFNQTFTNWKIYIRDDGSGDKTLSILEEYKILHPEQVLLVQDNKGNLGAARGFMTLLESVHADYYFFCDHDDVWLPYKIEKTLYKAIEIEKKYPNKAVVVFTDLCVVDQNLNLISSSLWQYSHINPEYSKNVYYLSVASTVTGCTMIINKQVKSIVLPYPKEALMHDWWIALNIAQNGIIDYIPEATILYRQHGKNAVGAEKNGWQHYWNNLLNISRTIRENKKVIQMLNKLSFKINHFKRLRIKIKVITLKTKQ